MVPANPLQTPRLALSIFPPPDGIQLMLAPGQASTVCLYRSSLLLLSVTCSRGIALRSGAVHFIPVSGFWVPGNLEFGEFTCHRVTGTSDKVHVFRLRPRPCWRQHYNPDTYFDDRSLLSLHKSAAMRTLVTSAWWIKSLLGWRCCQKKKESCGLASPFGDCCH